MLQIFIESFCSNGTLSNNDKNLIFKKGKEQGLNEAQIQKMIDEALQSSNDADLESGFIMDEDNNDNSENNNNEDLESGFIIDEENNNIDTKVEKKTEVKNTTQYPATIFSNVSELDNQGAMSLVQKGKLHGKWIIIKRIKPKFKDNAKYKELFFKEFENTYHLDHPNIVRLLDKGEDAEGAYYTMEFIDGRPISEVIGKNGVKNEKHIRKIFVQLLDGLTYVHKKQIFHRDLKPDNIYITFRGDNVKILDFGLAAADDFDDDLVKVGTPRYAAPEQMTKGNTVDQRADIYTLGLILLEMITGDVKDKTASTVSDANYKHIILKCLASNPNDRFDDCQDIQEALNTPIIKEKKNNIVKEDTPKPAKEKKKLPIVPIIIGILVVAIIVGGFLFKDKIFGGGSDGNNLSEAITKANNLYINGEFNSTIKLYDSVMNIDNTTIFKFEIEDINTFLEKKAEADKFFADDNYAKAKENYNKLLNSKPNGVGSSNTEQSEIFEIEKRLTEINVFYDKINFTDLKSDSDKGKWGLIYDGKIVVDYLFDEINLLFSCNLINVKKDSKWGILYEENNTIYFTGFNWNNKANGAVRHETSRRYRIESNDNIKQKISELVN